MVFSGSVIVPFTGTAGYNFLNETRDRQETLIKNDAVFQRETEYFKENISQITSAEELVDDIRLLTVALDAYGLGEELSKRAYIQGILESDLNDPASFANRASDTRWQGFAEGFLKSEISVPGPLDDAFGAQITQKAYQVELKKHTSQSTIDQIISDADDFRTAFAEIKTADDLVNNSKALTFIKATFGLEDDTASNAEIVGYLNAYNEFSLDDQGNDVVPDAWKEAREALSFYNETYIQGSEITSDTVHNSEQNTEEIIARRFEQELSQQTGHFDYEKEKTAFVEAVRSYTDIGDLLADDTSMAFLKEAFNLSNDPADTATIGTYLTQTDDLLVPSQWLAVRDALGYHTKAPEDKVGLTSLGQITDKHQVNTISVGDDIDDFNRFKKEADYFKLNISFAASDQDVVNDSRSLRFSLTAFGLESDALNSKKTLDVLTGDTVLTESARDQKWRDFRERFSFTSASINLKTQEQGFADEMIENLVDNDFIEAVGEQDQNLRLALNFEKRIIELSATPDVDTFGWFTVAGEPPLATVFQTAFGLPSSFGQLDVDQQRDVYRLRSQSVMGTPNLSEYNNASFVSRLTDTFLLRATISETSGAGVTSLF